MKETSTSIKAIDIGFDLRLHGMAIELPSNTTEVICDDLPGHGYDEQVVTGTNEEITQKLRGLGYEVRWK